MSTTIIIIGCILLLLAYSFEISSKYTKVPTVILLLLLGGLVKYLFNEFGFIIPDLNPLLPVIGTIGLILIVLDGSLDIIVNKTKVPLIRKSIIMSLVPMLLFAFGLAFLFTYLNNGDFKNNLVNAIPFSVISSAIAIPSVRNLSDSNREFVIYESSLSDIFGVLLFNFVAFNPFIDGWSIGLFAVQMIIIIVVSIVSVLGLSFLLSRIRHHVTFTPIILFVILIYFIAKEFHLPALLFILIFGLFLGNIDGMRQIPWIEKLRPEKLQQEVNKFMEVAGEATFLVRAAFFLLFGFLMEPSEILNAESFPMACGIVVGILMIRAVTLYFIGMKVFPLLAVAPRGLISILLFLSVLPEQVIPIANKSLMVQTVILSVLAMMFGLMFSKRETMTHST